jgi:hypothetical protein
MSTRPRRTVNARRVAVQPNRLDGILASLQSLANRGCLIKGAILLAFAAVILTLCIGSVALYEYYSIASSLPSVSDLQQRTSP